MEGLIPFLVIANAPRSQCAALAEQLIPIALLGPSSQSLTFTAINAECQLTRQATADAQVMRDAVRAGGLVTAAELADFPALQSLFNGLSEDVKATIFPPGST